MGDVDSYLTWPEALADQQLALALEDVLIEEDQAGAGSSTYSSRWSSRARPAS